MSVFYASIAQADHAVTPRGKGFRVGHEHQRCTVLVAQIKQQIHDCRAIGAVEIACRLIREQDRRAGCCCAGKGNALLLSA